MEGLRSNPSDFLVALGSNPSVFLITLTVNLRKDFSKSVSNKQHMST